jgi:small nuclear ribonucleoprotein (snRNP)-like protein
VQGVYRERALAERTLICLLQVCEGHKTIVELRNESFAEGIISQVDGYMNVNMKDVHFTIKQGSNTLHLEELFIQAKQIRFVHIPDEISMREAIEGQLKTLKNSRVPMTKKFQKGKKYIQKCTLYSIFIIY